MNIYLVSQSDNNGYDTYDSFVIVAETEQRARETDPSGGRIWKDGRWMFQFLDGTEKPETHHNSWVNDVERVSVELVGVAAEGQKAGIICNSFNAG